MRSHRFAGLALVAWLAFALGPVPAIAGSPKPKVKPVKTQTVKSSTPKGPKAKTQASSAKTAKTVKTHGAPAKTKAVKTQATTTKTQGAKAKVKATSADAKGSKATKSSSTLGSQDPGPVPLNKAQQQLTKNANLRAKVESRLPAGTDVMAAAADFRNLGQFMAAVNASFNQGYDFTALKALMTGPEGLSLGQAKQRLRGTDPSQIPGGSTDPSQIPGGSTHPSQTPGGSTDPSQTPGATTHPSQTPGGTTDPSQTPGTTSTTTKKTKKNRPQ